MFLDTDYIIRCGGRIHNAKIDSETKFPCLLPKKHPLTALVVHHTHKIHLHTGVNATVTSLRQKFWIPSARQIVRSLLRKCVTCRRVSGKSYSRPEPPLPSVRTKQSRPFEVTGVDFTGALHIKTMDGSSKVYVCLFTCGVSRAVHLEIVTDLSVETFLQALRRFAACRSLPRIMLSDNASSYEAAVDELGHLINSDRMGESLCALGIQWRFIPKRAPWYGGFWEHLIGLTKTTLRKVLGKALVTLPVLQTVIVEVEAVLNDRPLTYVSADLRDPEPLTPSHLLCGRRVTSLPHTIMDDEISDPTYGVASVRETAKRQSQLIQHFQSRWSKEYLTSLHEHHKTSGKTKQEIQVGDVVIIHDDTPRTTWKLAVVEKLITGLDGITRAAEIRTANGRTNRPITRLFPLEVKEDESSKEVQQVQPPEADVNTENTMLRDRPTREATVAARKRLKQWANIIRALPEDVAD